MLKDKTPKPKSDSSFTDEVAQFYESFLVPLIFEPYAADLAVRVKKLTPDSVLEVACGTGVVTRALANVLPESCKIIASDLNNAMINHAEMLGARREIEWTQADVMDLPFENEVFDIVVCQFSVMFFPNRVRAYKEIKRVLKPGGKFLFNVWNEIAENEFANTVTEAVRALFPNNPPQFLSRTPHGHGNPHEIKAELTAAGFKNCELIQRDDHSHAVNAMIPAVAYCHGTPLRNEIEEREPGSLERVTKSAASLLKSKYGNGQISGKISAVIVNAE